jgi:hypothetical protein
MKGWGLKFRVSSLGFRDLKKNMLPGLGVDIHTKGIIRMLGIICVIGIDTLISIDFFCKGMRHTDFIQDLGF